MRADPSRPRRCLLIADALEGGLGAAVEEHAAWMRGTGWEVVVAAPHAEGTGVSIPRSARDLPGMAVAAWRLRRLAAEFRPDVVHCHGLRCFGVARCAGLRPFVTVHGYGRVPSDPPGYHLIRGAGLRFAGRGALGAFSATPDLGVPWRFLPHGSPRLSALHQAPFRENGPPTFVWLGRLDVPKRPDIFVRAIAAIARTRSVQGVIAGSGSMEGSVRRLVERLGAPVTLVGHAGDVQSLLASAWGVVLFSRYEALSFSLQEAMWVGRPVVASRLPALEWLLGPCGVLVESEQEAAFALEALCDPVVAAETGRCGAERVRELLHPGAHWVTLEKAYSSWVA